MIDSARDSVAIQYTAADLRSLYKVCGKCRRNLMFIVAIPFFVVCGLPLLAGEKIGIYDVLPALIGSAFILALFLWVVPVYQVQVRKRTGWAPPLNISLDPQKLVARHPKASSEFYWEGVDRVSSTPERLYIFTTPACAVILPRHAFDSTTTFEDWCERASRYWADAQASRSPI